MIKKEEHQAARDLFFQTDSTQAEIARQVGVEPKTVYLWVKNGRWQEIKEAARRTPAILVEQYFTQLAEMNVAIANREEGARFPTLKEAETMRKLIVCINNIQKQTSLGACVDVVQDLINRINVQDHDLAMKVIDHAHNFLEAPARNGHKSHEPAYDVPEISPLERGQGCVEACEDENLTDISTSYHSQSIVNDTSLNSTEIEENILNMSPSPLEKDGMRPLIPDEQNITESHQSDDSQPIVNEEPVYAPKCVRDPDDPYTFYFDKITLRKFGSPKYGKPPEGFREVPKKDPIGGSHSKGFSRY